MKHLILSVIALVIGALVFLWMWNVVALLGTPVNVNAATGANIAPVPELQVIRFNPVYIENATVSAYTASPSETDERWYETADGTDLRVLAKNGVGIAACPSRFPFDSKVQWNGKWYRCADRMNKRYRDTDTFDFLVANKKTAFEIGRRQHELVTVWVKI